MFYEKYLLSILTALELRKLDFNWRLLKMSGLFYFDLCTNMKLNNRILCIFFDINQCT